jgi:hypothetical protein
MTLEVGTGRVAYGRNVVGRPLVKLNKLPQITIAQFQSKINKVAVKLLRKITDNAAVFVAPYQQVYFFICHFGELSKQPLYSHIPVLQATLVHNSPVTALTQDSLEKNLQLTNAARRGERRSC